MKHLEQLDLKFTEILEDKFVEKYSKSKSKHLTLLLKKWMKQIAKICI